MDPLDILLSPYSFLFNILISGIIFWILNPYQDKFKKFFTERGLKGNNEQVLGQILVVGSINYLVISFFYLTVLGNVSTIQSGLILFALSTYFSIYLGLFLLLYKKMIKWNQKWGVCIASIVAVVLAAVYILTINGIIQNILPPPQFSISVFISSNNCSDTHATIYVLNRMDHPVLVYGYMKGKQSFSFDGVIHNVGKDNLEIINVTFRENTPEIVYFYTDAGIVPAFYDCGKISTSQVAVQLSNR
jgi:hypothetical protein